MGKRNICLIKRLWLKHLGRCHAEKKRIVAREIENYFHWAQLQTEKENPGQKIECYISPFISHEFALFVNKRERLFRYEKYLVEIPAGIQALEVSNKMQKLQFCDAIMRLDKKIADLCSELLLCRVEYENRCKKIKTSMERQAELIAAMGGSYDMTHVVLACETAEDELQTKSNAIYKMVLQLLNEKVRLLENMRSILEGVFVCHLTRISCYMDAAYKCKESSELPTLPDIGEILKAYNPLFVLGRYSIVLADAQKQRIKTENDLKEHAREEKVE